MIRHIRTPGRDDDPGVWQEYIRRHVKEDPETGCWVWQGDNHRGYPHIPGITGSAWRIAYIKFHGGIPEEKRRVTISCGNRRCLSPDHLIALTYSEERRLRREWRGTATECQVDIRADGTAYVYTLTPAWERHLRRVRGAEDLGNGEFLLPPGTVRLIGQNSHETKNRWIADSRQRLGSSEEGTWPRGTRERAWTGWKDEEAKALGLAENEPDVG